MTLFRILFFLLGLGFIIYGFVRMLRLWPRDFFISEKERMNRSVKIGVLGGIVVFGIMNLALVFVDEDIALIQLINSLCIFGVFSFVAGVIGGISTYRRLEPFTKHKDDIGTIRDT